MTDMPYEEIPLTPREEEYRKTVNRTIIKMDLDGNFLKEYQYIDEASNDIDWASARIKIACDENMESGGYKWKYGKIKTPASPH